MIDDLLELASSARNNAYAPYSKFAVGAGLRGSKGGLYAGCNVENSAYPNCQCAEAAAIAAMVLDGERHIAEVVIVGPDGSMCTPCGSCRQRLYEFGDAATPVHVGDSSGLRMSTTLGELLPYAFSELQPEDC